MWWRVMEGNGSGFLVEGDYVVLKSGSSASVGPLLVLLLLLLEILIVDASEIVVVELDVPEFRAKDVHLGAVLEDDFVVEMQHGLFSLCALLILDEGLPNLGLFEDEDLDDAPVGTKQLIEIIVCDDVAELIVDAYKQYRPLLLPSTHIINNNKPTKLHRTDYSQVFMFRHPSYIPILYYIMMKEEEVMPSRDPCRQTTFGFNSQQHDQMDQLVATLVNTHHLALPALVKAFKDYPCSRDETKLLQHIFTKPQLVSDMLSFLLQPRKVAKKYNLPESQIPRYIYQLSTFMRDNFQFYELYFLLLEENSQLKEAGGQWQRELKDIKGNTFDQWFQFLEEKDINRDQRQAALGYIAEIFLPLVKYEFSSSSRVNDYYEERYKENPPPILLISHFSPQLVSLLSRHSHQETVFKVLFSLVLVSLEEQEWVLSLKVLTQICKAAIDSSSTSDLHIENIYKMVKEVAENISNDKNRTIFAFISAIIDSKLVEAALNKLSQFPLQSDPDPISSQEIIEVNINFIAEMVLIYFLLLKNGIDKNANKMVDLKLNVLKIREAVPQLLGLVRKMPKGLVNFSNGEVLRRTPLFVLGVLKIVRALLEAEKEFEEGVGVESSSILEFMQDCLGENRWNSVLHSAIEKTVGLVVTTDCFKAKSRSLEKFLQFLIEHFTNKKYVFLNSTRMANQGDTRSLYNICCKVTLSFEKACKSFGINNSYEEWGSFVVNVLQNYLPMNDRTNSAYLPETFFFFDSQDLRNSVQGQRQQAFTGYIDEAAQMKQSINRIDIIQKWKNKPQKKMPLQRTTSFQKLTKNPSKERIEGNPSPTGRNRVSIQPEKAYKSVLQTKFSKKLSQSGTFSKGNTEGQLPRPPQMVSDKILTLQNYAVSSEQQIVVGNSLGIKKANSLLSEEIMNEGEREVKLTEFDLKLSPEKKSAQ